MADDVNSEIIGGIGVTIGADYSSLQAEFTTAQGLAQTAGANIADALVSGAASAGDIADELAGQLDAIGPAADGAAHGLDDLGDSAGHAAEGAQEAEGSLAAMAEQLTAVGESLVITEGLRELGTEALGAADSITHASIALTTITGSGETAKETIEGLESLGMADGLAMPSLLTAATRMQQLLGPGADVVGLLGTIANGAAAMGTDIGSAADMFDRMAANGQVMSRSLGSVGLTMQQLATAVNQVNPELGATAVNLTSVFKTLDQEDRIAALQIAFQGLAGVAQQVAEQTFGGQWQQLANAWEGIMVEVGRAILPVVSDLTDFTKTEILPFVKEMVTDFNALPGPIKDAAAGFALATAAIIPLTGGLAAVGLAVSGLNGLLPAITGLMAAFGGEADVVAISAHAQAVATGEMAAAAAAAVPEVEALAVADQQLSFGFAEELLPVVGLVGEQMSLELLPAFEGVGTGLAALTTDVGAAGLGLMALGPISGLAVLSAASLKDGWSQVKDTFSNVAGTIENIPAVMQSVATGSGILATVAGDLKSAWSGVLSVFEQYNTYSLVAQGINKITDAVDLLLGITPGAATMTAAMNTELGKLQASGEAATKALGTMKDALTPLQTALSGVIVQQEAANDAYQKSLTLYNALNSSLQNGTPIYNGQAATANEVAKAFTAMQAAAAAAGISLAPIPGSMAAITAASSTLAAGTGFVVSALQEQANEQAVANSSLDLATTNYNRSIAALDAYVAQLKEAQAADDGSVAAVGRVVTAEQNLQKAYADSQKAETDLNTTAGNYATTMSGAVAKGQADALSGLETLEDALGPALAKFTGLDGEVNRLALDVPNFGVQMVSLSSGPIVGLQSALTEASAKVADLAAKMADGENVGQQYDKALTQQLNSEIALNQYSAEVATGLQGQSDAFSLATIAVAAAQAKYDTLNQAYQSNISLAPQVQSAQAALTTALKNLSAATTSTTADTGSLTDAEVKLYGAMGSLPPALSTVSSGLASVNTQAQSVAASLNDVAAAVKGIEADAQSAFGSGSGSQSVSAPAGYTASEQFLPGIMGGGSEIVTWVPDAATIAAQAKAYEQQLYNQGYTPVAIAAKTTMPLAQVLADLGLTAAQATITESQAKNTSTSSAGNVVLDPNQPVLTLPGSGTTGASSSTGSGTTVSTGSTVSTSSGSSPAIDGGSYPAVTAHQASGEVWAVSGTASSGGSSSVGSSISTTINNSVTGASAGSTAALTGATQAVGGAIQQLATTQGPIATSAEVTAQAAAQIATAVGGLVVRLNAGTTGTASGGTTGATGGGGTAYPTGAPSMTVAGGNPQGSIASSPTASSPPYNPSNPLPTGIGGGTVTNSVSVNIDARGSMGLNTQAIVNQVTAAVSNTLVGQLRSSGARF